MPSGPPELHAKWESDNKACLYLEDKGYKLSRSWLWTLPSPSHQPTEEENEALDYLVLEWDYGRLDPSQFPAGGS